MAHQHGDRKGRHARRTFAAARSHRSPVIFLRGKGVQRLHRRHEVIGPADGCRIEGEGVADAILCPGHACEHTGEAVLVAAEADEHRAMLGSVAKGGIAAEDMLFHPMLFDRRARDMGLRAACLLSEFGTRLFGPSDNLLLLLNRERLEGGGIVQLLLHHHHASSCTGRSSMLRRGLVGKCVHFPVTCG